jgi:hypothetical protein
MRIVAVAKPARRHENLSPALHRFFVELRSTDQCRNRVSRALLLLRIFLRITGLLLLLLFRARSLIRLATTYRSKQQQSCPHDNESMWHRSSP